MVWDDTPLITEEPTREEEEPSSGISLLTSSLLFIVQLGSFGAIGYFIGTTIIPT